MITCACGKTIEKVPDWLQSVKVDFVCNNCPNRTAKNIALIQLDLEPKAKAEDDEAVDEALVDDDAEVEIEA